MKAYTDLEQSKKLKKVLPPESADMTWCFDDIKEEPFIFPYRINIYEDSKDVPAWSLAALLKFISYPTLSQGYDGKWACEEFPKNEEVGGYENPIDACVEIILKHYE